MNASNRYPAVGGPAAPWQPAQPLARERLLIHVWQVIADVALILLSFAVASLIWRGEFARPNTMLAAQMYALLYVTLALYNGTYSLRALSDWMFAAQRALVALVLAAGLLNLVAFFLKANANYSRVSFTLGSLIALILLAATRVLAVKLTRRLCGPSPINLLVINDGGPPVAIAHARQVEASDARFPPALDDPHGLDRLGRILENMDQVIVSCEPDRRLAWSMALKSSGIDGSIVSEKVREMGAIGVRRYDQAGIYALLVSTGPLELRARVIKRLFDLVAASLGLILLALPLALVALAIRLDDGGPVLFVQNRVGRGNRLFRMYKFRTMRVEANDADGEHSTEQRDDRVTAIGGFLRRTSLDELPQLVNVVIGNMSLVGPRPHALGSQAGDKPFWLVDHRYWQRHSLKPGLTGLAQSRGLRGTTRSEAELAGRLQADLEYLSGWSLWRDIAILVSTLKVLVHDRAY